MHIAVKLDAPAGKPSAVEYRWDADTDILSAHVRDVRVGPGQNGMTGSVEIEGADGSWLILDVRAGQIAGVEVAVWPDVKNVGSLVPPSAPMDASVSIPARSSQPGIAALEVDTRLTAEADAAERTIRFRLGSPPITSVVRAAADLLLELDERQHLVGVWMLNVPPFPSDP